MNIQALFAIGYGGWKRFREEVKRNLESLANIFG